MGFEAVHIGGPGKPDGIADANLSADGKNQRRYRISLEAKSKEDQNKNKKVSAKTVGVSAIARQRDSYNCEHAVVVGPDFPDVKDGKTALEIEIKSAQEKNGKTITLIRVHDLARLVRLVPQKRLGLPQLRELFQTCRMPAESHAWVNSIEKTKVEMPPYKEILEVIERQQRAHPDTRVTYNGLRFALADVKQIKVTEDDLRVICQAMMQMAGTGYLLALRDRVELSQAPTTIFKVIAAVTKQALNEDGTQTIC
jgi:hypothetical protein